MLKNRNMQLLTLSYFCANYVFYNLFNWVPHYFAAVRGFDEQEAGFVISIQWIMAAIGATLGGFACDYITRRAGLRKGCRWTSLIAMAASGLTSPRAPKARSCGNLPIRSASAPTWRCGHKARPLLVRICEYEDRG